MPTAHPDPGHQHHHEDEDHLTRSGRQAAFDGMSVRDFFAAHALAGLLGAYTGDTRLPSDREAAEDAYGYADAMLKKRGHPPAV